MPPKWAFLAFDIFYNAFNRRITLNLKVETSYFFTYCGDIYLAKKTLELENTFINSKYRSIKKNSCQVLVLQVYR